MRKFYVFVGCIICGVSMNVQAGTGDDLLIAKIELDQPVADETAPVPSVMPDGVYSLGNGRIEIASHHLTVSKDKAYNDCFEALSPVTPYYYNWAFDGNPAHNTGMYSSIVIRNTGELKLTKIEVSGFSNDDSEMASLRMDISEMSTPASDNDYTSFADGFTLEYYYLPAATTHVCTPRSFDIQEVASMEGYGEAKAVRLRYSNAFNETANATKYPRIQKLHIYVEDDGLSTSIPATENSSFYISYTNNILLANRNCRIEIYDISGKRIQSVANTQRHSIEHLPVGIYMVKAEDSHKNTTIKKVVKSHQADW